MKISAYSVARTTVGDVPSLHQRGAEVLEFHDGRTVANDGEFVELFGFQIYDTRIDAAARWLVQRAHFGAPASIAFLNAHCVNVAYRDHRYRAAMSGFDRIFADGSGVRMAARAFGHTLRENVNGTDLFPVLCQHASQAGVSLFLLGGREGVAAKAAATMCDTVEDLSIAGTASAYFKSEEEEDRMIKRINDSGAKIVLVGMGVPLQEAWIAQNRHRLSARVVIGVGGLFDYYSGRIPRAPLAFRAAGLEWVWRLAMEPTRLARRYLLGNIEFVTRLALLKLMGGIGGSKGLQA